MAGKERLKVLLKTFQATEREAVAHMNFVDSIASKRREKFNRKLEKFEELKVKVDKALGEDRFKAVQSGNVNLVGACSSYGKRMKLELATVETELDKLRKELSIAEERAREAEQEVLEARVERKKIERLLSQQLQRGQIRDEALDAERVDELAQYQSHKSHRSKS